MLKIKETLINFQNHEISQYTCVYCDDIANSAVRCLICKSLYCYECTELLKCQQKDCIKHQGILNEIIFDHDLNNKIIKDLTFSCSNQGCFESLTFNKISFHYLICDFLFKHCNYLGCKYKGKAAELDLHRLSCQFIVINCCVCNKILNKGDKLSHNCLSTFVEEIIVYEQNLISNNKIYLSAIDSISKELKEIMKLNKSFIYSCKICFATLSWIEYHKTINDCSDLNCVKGSRYHCYYCSFYYCLKCVPPPINKVCGCKKEME